MEFLRFFDLNTVQFAAIIAVAVLVGMGKAGLSGTVVIGIPLLASVLGARNSTGLMLLFFISADVFAVKAYYKGVRWDEIKRLLPATVVGIALGALTGNFIDDRQFKILIAIIVLVSLGLMLLQEFKGGRLQIPQNLALAIVIGVISGFSSMVGNAAGSIFAVYLLALGLNKKNFLGTSAIFFFIVNLIKLPVQVFIWQSVDWRSFLLVLLMLPLVYTGIRFGLWAVRHFNEKAFRYLVTVMTVIAAVRLFF